MKKVILFVVIIVIVGGGAFSYFLLPDILASSERMVQTEEIRLESGKAGSLVLYTNFDEVSIVQHSGPEEIVIKAEIELNLEEIKGKEMIEKNLKLDALRRGSRVSVEAVYSRTLMNHFSGISGYLYLTVYVPKGILIESTTEGKEGYYGDLSNSLILNDGKGEIAVENLKGNIKILDQEGGIFCSSVEGDIEIDDEKGDIDISDVSGSLFLKGISDSIYAENISGNVSIQSKGAVISITNGKGDF